MSIHRPTNATGQAADLRDQLQRAYAQADGRLGKQGAPGWAYPLPATIPFVGEHYEREGGPRLLIYASAEHLGTAEKDKGPWLAEGQPGATDRHQIAWRGGWHPNPKHTRVGIAPYENGPLLAAAALLWRWLHDDERVASPPVLDPVALTEHVAVANFSKFALPPVGDRKINVDASTPRQVRDSLPFVRADLRVLRPHAVLVAKALPAVAAVEVTQHAARLGAQVVYTLQGSGLGPSHAKRHLERLGLSEASLSLGEALGEAGHAALQAFEGHKMRDLEASSLKRWFALLRARYEATASG